MKPYLGYGIASRDWRYQGPWNRAIYSDILSILDNMLQVRMPCGILSASIDILRR